MKRVNIAFHIGSMAPGGTEKYVIRILGSLPKSKFKTHVIIDEKNGILLQDLINNVDDVKEIKYKSGFINRIIWLFQTHKYLTSKKIDILQAHNDTSMLFVLFAGYLARIKTLIYSQRHAGWLESKKAEDSYRFWSSNIKNILIGSVAKYIAKVILVNSKYGKKKISNDYNILFNKIHVIHNCIKNNELMTKSEIKKLKITENISTDRITIGVVSSLLERKNINLLIKAAQHLINEPIQYVIIGEGPEKLHLQKKIDDLNLKEIFFLLGAKNNVLKWIQLFDIAVLPSLTEGFPNVILEYMICNKPVVASNIHGIPEIIVSEETGILVKPNNENELVNVIKKLINDPGLCMRMGNQGRNRVIKYFNQKSETDKHINLYESLVA